MFTQLGCVPFVNRVVSESWFELVRGKADVCFLSHGAFNCDLVDHVLD